jgi:hypothetical protein
MPWQDLALAAVVYESFSQDFEGSVSAWGGQR